MEKINMRNAVEIILECKELASSINVKNLLNLTNDDQKKIMRLLQNINELELELISDEIAKA